MRLLATGALREAEPRPPSTLKVFVRFDDALRRLEMYLQNEKESGEAQQLTRGYLAMRNSDDIKAPPKPAGRAAGGAGPAEDNGILAAPDHIDRVEHGV